MTAKSKDKEVAKVVNKEVVGSEGGEGKSKKESGKSVDRKRSVSDKPKKGVIRYINLTDKPIALVSHIIPSKGHKDFMKAIGNAIMKSPIVLTLIRLKKLKVETG